MVEPTWAKVHYPAIDYQKIIYYSAPKSVDEKRPKSLDEVDPELLAMYEKLGVPLKEQGDPGRRRGRRRLRLASPSRRRSGRSSTSSASSSAPSPRR